MKNINFKELEELLDVGREGFLIDYKEPLSKEDLVSIKNSAGDMLLHVAASMGRMENVKYLLSIGSPVNEKGDFGYTPLHYAAESGFKDVYTYLVRQGANEDVKNAYGDVARDLFVNQKGKRGQ